MVIENFKDVLKKFRRISHSRITRHLASLTSHSVQYSDMVSVEVLTNTVHPIQGPRATECRGILNEG